MTTKPVLEKISDEVVLRLKNITVANGYQFTIQDVRLTSRKTNTWQPRPLTIRVEQGTVSENEDLSYPGNPPRKAFDMEFVVYGYASDIDRDESEVGMTDSGVTDTQMIAAIQKALTNNDAAAWHTFDGNAIIADVTDAEPFDSPEYDGGKVTLSVTYRTSEINPFS